jgi:UDP:flavonoid glycosyltransferase YjiC (YdhE family)
MAIQQCQGEIDFVWSLAEDYQQLLPHTLLDSCTNLLVVPFMAQLEVLSHASVKAAHLHGGANGLNEVLSAGKPLICMPFDGDQPENCLRALDAKVAITIMPHQASHSPSQLRAAYRELIGSKHLQHASRHLQRLIQHTGGYKQAADLVLVCSRVCVCVCAH